MSLDVYLMSPEGDELFWANITHNLTAMADAAGIYECLWRPDEHGMHTGAEVAVHLEPGLLRLALDPEKYKTYDSPNGWGMYRNFLPWCAAYLAACKEHSEARVEVSR